MTDKTPAATGPFDFLTEVVNTDAIENGAWAHLEYAGTALYLDMANQKQPSRFRIRSTSSNAFEEHLDKIQRRTVDRQRRGGRLNKAQKEQLIKDLKRDGPESFAALVTEMDNVSRQQPGTIRPTREDLLVFASNPHNRWAVDFALEYAAEDSNYGNLGDTPTGNDAGSVDQKVSGPAESA